MPAHNAAYLPDRRGRQRANRQGTDNAARFHRLRHVAIGHEITAMAPVPMLDWPANLFVDASAMLDVGQVDFEPTVNARLCLARGIAHAGIAI